MTFSAAALLIFWFTAAAVGFVAAAEAEDAYNNTTDSGAGAGAATLSMTLTNAAENSINGNENNNKVKILSVMTICLKSSEVAQKYMSVMLSELNYEVYVLRPRCCNETIRYDTSDATAAIHLIEFEPVVGYKQIRSWISHYRVDKWIGSMSDNCRRLLSDFDLMSKLRAIPFDLSIVQLWDGCGFVVSDMLGLKRIDFVIQGLMYPQLNKMYNFIYYDFSQNNIIPPSGSDHTFEVYQYVPLFDGIRAEFNVSIATQQESWNTNTEFVFVPVIPGFEFPNYFVPKIQFIGPVRSSQRSAESERDYEKHAVDEHDSVQWLNSAEVPADANVVFVCFGTLWLKMPELEHRDRTAYQALNLLLSRDHSRKTYVIMRSILSSDATVAQLEQQLVSRYPDRLRVYDSWIPQSRILAHEKLKAIVLHCGIGTLQEAMFHGVPMVPIPFQYDQPLNAEKAVRIGIAHPALNVSTFTAQALVDAIHAVLDASNDFAKQAKRWATAMQSYHGKEIVEWAINCMANNISATMQLPSHSIALKYDINAAAANTNTNTNGNTKTGAETDTDCICIGNACEHEHRPQWSNAIEKGCAFLLGFIVCGAIAYVYGRGTRAIEKIHSS